MVLPIFHKKKATPAEEPKLGEAEPVSPDTTKSLSFQLSSMLPELSKAQMLDPALKDVIMYLKKQPAKTYFADPWRETRKTQARAAKYVLRTLGDATR